MSPRAPAGGIRPGLGRRAGRPRVRPHEAAAPPVRRWGAPPAGVRGLPPGPPVAARAVPGGPGAAPAAPPPAVHVPAPPGPARAHREPGLIARVRRHHGERPAARPAPPGAARALSRLGRSPAPRPAPARRRLRAAWDRLLAEHGRAAADLRLIGVYGPVPLGAVRAVALDAHGRAVIETAGGSSRGPTGDLAVARRLGDGRLVCSSCPYPRDSPSTRG